MKVLFLDVDGVLNGHEKHPDSPYTTIRPDCVRLLNDVITATDCKVVVSSAWRYMMLRKRKNQAAAMTLLGFQYMLHTHGLLGASTVVIGHTCSDEEIPERGKQILRWCLDNLIPKANWAAVDDDPMAMELGEHQDRLVQTNGKRGLRPADVRKLVALLGKAAHP